MKHCHFTPDYHGEIVVSGRKKIDVELRHRQPERVHVAFCDDPEIVPCNPQHFDALEWEIHYKHGHYVLVISWQVSGTRSIEFGVKY